jgi:hypothetical protein
LTDADGNLLWSPNDFGSYSTEKVQLITSILSALLSDVTLKMETSLSDESLANVYSKDESNERFIQKSDTDGMITPLVQSKVDTYLASGGAVSKTELENLQNIVASLRTACVGLNLDGTAYSGAANSLLNRVLSLEEKETSDYSLISKIMGVVYEVNKDGSFSETVRLALDSELGDLTALNKAITSRSSAIAAINFLYELIKSSGSDVSGISDDVSTLKENRVTDRQDIENLQTKVGTGTLNTTNKNLVDAVNEVLNKIPNTSTLTNDVKTLKEGLNKVNTSLGDISTLDESISDKSDIVKALNSIASSITSIDERLRVLEGSSASLDE